MKIAAAGLAVVLLLAGCSSNGGSYKTITCKAFTAKANASDAVSNGSLTIASDYMDSAPIDPKGGANDTAAFGDQILTACAGVSDGTRIVSLRSVIVAAFLAEHPEDAR